MAMITVNGATFASGQRYPFEAEVVEFGTKNGYNDPKSVTIRFKDMKFGNIVVCSDLWMHYGKHLKGASPKVGDIIEFEARIYRHIDIFGRDTCKVQRPIHVRNLGVKKVVVPVGGKAA